MITKQQRFWQRVSKNGPFHKRYGRCWVWNGPTLKKNGYGKAGTLGLCHRFSYSTEVGPIPAGLSVLHKCDNRVCVRPSHLFVGTQQDNLADMRAKGKQVRGEKQGGAKVTEEIVREIRRRYKRYSYTDGTGALSKEFNISPVQVYRIAKSCQWRHVDA